MKALDNDVDATEITSKVTLPEFKDKAMYDILNAQNIIISESSIKTIENILSK